MSQKRKSVCLDDLIVIEAESASQEKAMNAFDEGQNLVLSGSAGTGKTFIALHMAFEEILNRNTPYDEVIIIRSIVPTRDIGFLPGNQDEKINVYQAPYRNICGELFERKDAYEVLENQHKLKFETTSFIRGLTFDNAIIIVDEMQNMSGHELDTIITRLGQSCRIIFSGDYYQSDFTRQNEKRGVTDFIEILKKSRFFTVIDFSWEDILRSDIVRDYLMTKDMLKKSGRELDW